MHSSEGVVSRDQRFWHSGPEWPLEITCYARDRLGRVYKINPDMPDMRIRRLAEVSYCIS